jgi:hypothetical protein
MKKILAVAILMMAFSALASADTVSAGDGWHVWSFGAAGSAGNPTFDFTAAGPVHITVTDAFLAGDIFDVYDNGSLLGSTSSPTAIFGSTCGANPDACLAGGWSSGIWNLGAGSHLISFIATTSPFPPGDAYFRVDRGSVPEPGTLALLGTGLLGFGFRRRRKI